MSGKILHRCSYCEKIFKSEARFLKHHCKEKDKAEKLNSITGKRAFSIYQKWMRKKFKTSAISQETFKNSKYFNAFYKFAIFVKKANIPDIDSYINLMDKMRVDPVNWTNDIAYSKYIEHISRVLTPKEMVKITIKTIFDIAEAADVDVSEVFDVLYPNEVIHFIQQRKLSPWFLLNSKKFANFYANKTNKEEKKILERLMNPDFWIERFKNHENEVKNIKRYVAEMGL